MTDEFGRNRFGALAEELTGHHLQFLARAPVARFGEPLTERLMLALDELLGRTEALQIARRAAQDASWPLLAEVMATGAVRGTKLRLRAASDLFAAMGQGRLKILAESGGGAALGRDLYESRPWSRDLDPHPIRHHPIDPFATGFVAAASEIAVQTEPHSMLCRETECRAMGHEHCRFELDPVTHTTGGTSDPLPEPVDVDVFERRVGHSFSGHNDDRISLLTAALGGLLERSRENDPDLAQAFGQRMPLELVSYRLQTLFTTIHRIEHRGAELRRDAEERIGRAIRNGATDSFRTVLHSSAWQQVAGGQPKHVEDTLDQLCALARGLGFGRWVLHSVTPFSRVVFRTPASPEGPFYLKRFGESRHPRCLLFAHSARAAVGLAHRAGTSQSERHENRWQVEETRCLTMGDDLCEAVITATDDDG